MIHEKEAEKLPERPGVYIFRGKRGTLYIGKAQNLRKRVLSHLHDKYGKSARFVKEAEKIDFIITENEVEALLLEDILIKKEKPRYNVKLRDDKKYPYIKVTVNEEFPRVFYTRNVKEDGSIYFGPYTHVKAVRKVLRSIRKIFPLRSCKGKRLPQRACMDYYIKRCAGPCIGAISKEKYQELVKGVIEFLSGKIDQVEEEIEKRMWEAAEKEEFEEAARLRDQLLALRKITQSQKVVLPEKKDIDILGFSLYQDTACAVVFQIRRGKLTGKEDFILKGKGEEKDFIERFLISYYRNIFFIPPLILIPSMPENKSLLENYLSQKQDKKVEIRVPERGIYRKLMEMACENAERILDEEGIKVRRRIPMSVLELQHILNLPSPPRRIEGFDVSNLHGKYAVGSCVVFVDGKPKKSEYRRFKIKEVEGINDPAMIREIVKRRIRRIIEERKEKPDMILIDGGRTQLSAALSVIKDMEIPAFGLAKRLEQLYLPDGRIISIPQTSPALKLLQRIRNEAHRFAITYHRKLRERITSSLDLIPGIGKKKKLMLLRFFGSEERIRKASKEELMRVKGIGEKLAAKIYRFYHE